MEQGTWISAETQPKEEKYYIVNAPGVLGIWVAYWDSEDWIHPDRGVDGERRKITEFVMHYMPLPSPPINK